MLGAVISFLEGKGTDMEHTLLSLGFDSKEVDELMNMLEDFGTDAELNHDIVGMAHSGADMDRILDFVTVMLDIA